MKFKIQIEKKVLIFNSELKGLKVYGKEYVGGEDGILIYDKTRDIKADEVELQMSSNTSTLIPALRVLSIPYHLYFDQREVVGSQNNISFYWNKSKLAAFYNKFSTDRLDYEKRESIIKKAVNFLIKNSKNLPLKEEFLARVLEHCKLLGFYQGFPIFDSSFGFAKLQSRLGIHIDSEAVMISTPLDKYEKDVYQIAQQISELTKEKHVKKKNRVVFSKTNKILKLFGIEGLV